MLQILNQTPFAAALTVCPDPKGIDTVIGVIKASFGMGANGIHDLKRQPPVQAADVYWAKPGASSIKYASELSLSKPATDIVMLCHAIAPGNRAVKALQVSLTVGPCQKTLYVYGDRYWKGGFGFYHKTDPQPFTKKAVVYENAFGGTDPDHPKRTEPRNPVGCGIRTETGRPIKVPNVIDPKQLITSRFQRPEPAGFGYIGPNWSQRAQYAGTYDETWKKQRAPFLPGDFDPRFFNAAHPDLIARGYLKGGEPVRIINVSADGPFAFELPKIGFECVFEIAGQQTSVNPVMDTLLIEPDHNRFSMIFRACASCGKKVLQVESMQVYPDQPKESA
jgi:hypothetical protein